MFDPYHKWLGILPKDQPPNHYRLLSLELYEGDLDVIEGAADRQMGFIRQYQSGEHAALAAKLLNEIATARLCLLKPKSKIEYDANLRKQREALEPVKNDGVPFDIDDELAELTKAPKRSPRSKSKKKSSSQGLLVAGGIGGGIVVLLLVLILSQGRKPQPQTDPVQREIVASNPPQSPGIETSTTSQTVVIPKTKPVTESKLVVEAVGPPVDLIAAVDLKRDLFVGEWKREGNSLIGGPNGGLYLPAEFPTAYQLKFTVNRLSGNESLCIGFSSEGRAGIAVFDGWGSTFSGICMDGREANGNCTSRPGTRFQNGRTSTVILTVYPHHVYATVDGQKIVDWYGQSERMFAPSYFGISNRELPFLVTHSSSFEIESAEMIPIRPEPEANRVARLDEWLDVMPLLDTALDAQAGVWALNNNTLKSPGSPFAKYSLPVAVPEEYTLSATLELPIESSGSPTLLIGLVAGNSWCSIPIVNGDCVGLEKIDGMRWNENETRLAGTFIPPRKPVKLACTVTKRGIRMDLDGRTLINWSGDFQRLSPPEDWVPNDARKLFFGTNTSFKLSDIKLGPPVDPPILPEHPPLTIGNPLDLLALIDLKRDALAGTWVKDGTALRVMGDADAKLVIPCEVPEEYKLTMRITREGGGKSDDALMLKLPTKDSMAELALDGWGKAASGVFLDHVLPIDKNNESVYRVAVIPPGVPHDLVVFVRNTGLKLMSGGKTVLDWSGNQNRLSPTRWWGTPGARIGIGSASTRFRFEKLEIEVLEPTSFSPVVELGSDGNLLSIVDPQRDSRKGTWKLDAKELVSPNIPNARLRIPTTVPDRYALSAKVERISGNLDLLIGLVVGGRPCTAKFDGEKGTQAGLIQLDGKPLYDAASLTRRVYKTPLLPVGKIADIRCVVLPDTVIVTCGDKEVLRWHGDSRRFSYSNEYLPPNYSSDDRDHLWLGDSQSEFVIRELKLKPLSDEEADRIARSFTGVFPTTSQANVPLEDVAAMTGDSDGKDRGGMKETKSAMTPKIAPNSIEQLSKGKWNDLLELVKLPEDSPRGKWEKQNGAMVCEPGDPSATDPRFMVPVALRGSYEVNCDFTRRSGDGYVAIVFPVGLTACSIGLGMNAGADSGFGLIDGLRPDELLAKSNAVARPGKLTNGKRYQLHLDVIQTAERVTLKATLDGKRFVVWQGAVSQLSCAWWQAFPCPQCMGVVVNESRVEVQKLELHLKNDAKAYLLGSDWISPLSQAADGPSQEISAKCLTWNGRKYFISEEAMTYPMAQRLAAQLRGRLLTISSLEEEKFIYEQGRGHNLWTSLWRREGTKDWRDERNRPMRYKAMWGAGQPNLSARELNLAYYTSVDGNRGVHDIPPLDSILACIEWGEEYPDDE